MNSRLRIASSCLIVATCFAALADAGLANDTDEPISGKQFGTLRLDPAELRIWNDAGFKRRFVESYIAATDIEPTLNEDEREEMFDLYEMISADETAEAEEDLLDMIDGTTNAVFDYTLANIYFQREQFDRAAASYRIAVEKFPNFRRAWKHLGLSQVRMNQFKEALPALTRVIELGGSDSISYGLLGFAYSNTGNHLSAETAYRNAILLDPVTVEWKMHLARNLFEQKRYPEAVALFETLIAAQPGSSDLWLLQANAYLGMNKPRKAAENYEIVDTLGGATPDSLNMLGDIYSNEKLYRLAVKAYVRAMEAEPQGSPERAIRAAQFLAGSGAGAEARDLIAKTESLKADKLTDQERTSLLKIRSRLALAEGAGEEEARVLEEIVRIDPLDGDALILLGEYYRRTNNMPKAILAFERAGSIEGFARDAKVAHAQLLVGEGKYAEALPLLRQAQSIEFRESVQVYLEQVERGAKSGS